MNSSGTDWQDRGHTGCVRALCVLPDGRVASGSDDHTIRLRDPGSGAETARLEVDAPITCLAALTNACLVAADMLGQLHWLSIDD
jgi:WD40 repeat protein